MGGQMTVLYTPAHQNLSFWYRKVLLLWRIVGALFLSFPSAEYRLHFQRGTCALWVPPFLSKSSIYHWRSDTIEEINKQFSISFILSCSLFALIKGLRPASRLSIFNLPLQVKIMINTKKRKKSGIMFMMIHPVKVNIRLNRLWVRRTNEGTAYLGHAKVFTLFRSFHVSSQNNHKPLLPWDFMLNLPGAWLWCIW